MKEIYKIIFFFMLLNFVRQEEKEVINSCGKIGYGQPTDESECIEKGEYCCFMKIKISDTDTRSYCVTSPSEIDIGDVKEEIEKYTDVELLKLKCNISHFINNSLIINLLILCLFF